jgi:hypothetical protein
MEMKHGIQVGARCGWLLAIGLGGAQAAFGATLPTATSIAAEMGMGWNLGNTMEATGGPTAWGNPLPTQTLIDSVKAAGFRTVRIPCAWNQYADSTTHAISSTWMAQVKQVVDFCVKDSLFVVLNIHWDGGWLENHVDSATTRPALLATLKTKQGSYWRQIATAFKAYDRHVLFASANEPAVDSASAEAVLLQLHQVFVDTVRATGGNNATRTLVVQGPSTDIEKTNQWMNALPVDPASGRMMVEDHFYPYQFTLMTQDASWGNAFYYWGSAYHSTTDVAHNATWGEEAWVDSMFGLLKTKFVDQGIPVVLGEFGAIKRTSLTGDSLRLHVLSRRHFYNAVVADAMAKGLIPIAWDAGNKGDGTMSVFDRTTGGTYDLGLLNAIRAGAGLPKLAGDTVSDYILPTGDNSLRILYSAKDSLFGQVSLPVVKRDMTGYDSVLVRAWVKGTSTYDSAGTTCYGFVSLSLVTMSNNWTWREGPFGQLAMDAWNTYRIPVSSNLADTAIHALIPADRSAIDFFALQAYSKGFHGAIFVDWIVFKNKTGTADTVYDFNQTGPEAGQGDVQSVALVPTSGVAADVTWLTQTTSKWTSSGVARRSGARDAALSATWQGGLLRATWTAPVDGRIRAELVDLRGVRLWSGESAVRAGENVLVVPTGFDAAAVLRVRQGSLERSRLLLGR